MAVYKLLIIEDDQDINDVLYREFKAAGYDVIRAWSGTEGRLLLSEEPDVVITDLMLPGMSGEDLIPQIDKCIPVIALSAKTSTESKVNALRLGCVDYVTKPFDINELKARVETHTDTFSRLKAAGAMPDGLSRITFGKLTLDPVSHAASTPEGEVHLTRTEFAILKFLVNSRGRVVSKDQILASVSIDTPDLVESSIKVHISNIRRKLKTLCDDEFIESVWGIGFKANEVR